MLVLGWCYSILLVYACALLLHNKSFGRKRDSIAHRIHVNGIRGKSTVTRYVAAILRESGLQTYGKTTGTAARVLLPNGEDSIIKRRGYPNVKEQLTILKSFAHRKAEAVVIECMAVNPDYQGWLEDKVMHSSIGIITNVRIDHQEEMGQGLLDIARSISRTMPTNGTLITAESNPDVLTILREEAARKHSTLIEAPVSKVKKSDLNRFNHVAHKENVAIGLAVAEIYGVNSKAALAAMVKTRQDPGAFEVKTLEYKGKIVKWANLFAVNDKESFAEISGGLVKEYGGFHRIAILNNRQDRPSRVTMFCRLVVDTFLAQTVIAFGDYERQVEGFMADHKVKALALGNTGNTTQLSGEELFERIVTSTSAKNILLVGAVNIHTQQAERLLEFVAELSGVQTEDEDLTVFDSRRFTAADLQLILTKSVSKSISVMLRSFNASSDGGNKS